MRDVKKQHFGVFTGDSKVTVWYVETCGGDAYVL